MSKYTTGEIAKLCDVSVRTVQYYDGRGILVPSELSEGGRRLYSDNDLSKMKLICFLRDLDLSLDSIARIMKEENSDEVISLILSQQEKALDAEIADKQKKLERLKDLRASLKQLGRISAENIGDMAKIMDNKRNMKKFRIALILSAIPMEIVEWFAFIYWLKTGTWWPFLVYTVLIVPYCIWFARFYFKRVAYICPQCHDVFKPNKWEAFWASHTPTARKLTCTCGYKGYCVEVYENTANTENKSEDSVNPR